MMNLNWHSVLGVTLCVLLIAEPASSQPAPSSTREQISVMAVNSNLEVKLRDGKKLKGKLVSAGEMGFELRPPKGGFSRRAADIVTIPYSDVQSVKRHRMSPGEFDLLVTVIIVAGIIVATAVVASAVGER